MSRITNLKMKISLLSPYLEPGALGALEHDAVTAFFFDKAYNTGSNDVYRCSNNYCIRYERLLSLINQVLMMRGEE